MADPFINHAGGRLAPEARLRCAHCDSGKTRIVNTRGNGQYRRRRYKCADCGTAFSTVEIPTKLRQGCGLTAGEQLAAQERQAFLADLALDELLDEIRRRAGKDSLQGPYLWPNP